MSRVRLSIASLMAIVAAIALWVAALTHASRLWASAMSTLALAVLSAAVVGAIARHGRERMAWLGAAVFGWSYLYIHPSVTAPTPFLMELLRAAQPYIKPLAGVTRVPDTTNDIFGYYKQVAASLDTLAFAGLGALVGGIFYKNNQSRMEN